MPRDIRDRRGRVLTQVQRKQLKERAKAIKKSNKRKTTPGEIMQYVFVVLIILAIIIFAVNVVM